jgi:hypothetical protein
MNECFARMCTSSPAEEGKTEPSEGIVSPQSFQDRTSGALQAALQQPGMGYYASATSYPYGRSSQLAARFTYNPQAPPYNFYPPMPLAQRQQPLSPAASRILLQPGICYTQHFLPSGLPTTGLELDRFGFPILPHSRGVFLKSIPAFTTVTDIVRQIRGGAIERVDFHNNQNRTCVGVYFVLASDAERYIKFTRKVGGVYWKDCGMISTVEAIPRAKGGHEAIKNNVARGIREEQATRCLLIENLPAGCKELMLRDQIKRQSASLSVEFDDVVMLGDRMALVKMASIGTALGARLKLRGVKFYRDCRYRFVRDDCEGSLQELQARWARERLDDGVRHKWGV